MHKKFEMTENAVGANCIVVELVKGNTVQLDGMEKRGKYQNRVWQSKCVKMMGQVCY